MLSLRHGRRARSGYTLIELVMVILLLGIMLSFTFAKVDYLSPRYSLRAVAREIARTVALARSQAATQGRVYFVKYRFQEKSYYILAPFEDPPTDSQAAGSLGSPNPSAGAPPIPALHWEPVFRKDLPAGTVFRDIVVGGEKIEDQDVTVEISPFGLTKGHVVHLTDGTRDYSIDINPLTGAARFHEEYYEPQAQEQDPTK